MLERNTASSVRDFNQRFTITIRGMVILVTATQANSDFAVSWIDSMALSTRFNTASSRRAGSSDMMIGLVVALMNWSEIYDPHYL